MKVLHVGATGLVGRLVLARLLQSPRVERVVAPTRRALQMTLKEFGEASLKSDKSIPMNAQCTVFAESEVVSLIHSSTPKNDIAKAVLDADLAAPRRLARVQPRQRRAKLIGRTVLQHHRAGGHIHSRNADRPAQFGQRRQHIGAARFEQGFLGEGSGRDEADDVARHQRLRSAALLRLFGRFDLFGNRHPAARLDQPRQIAFRRMHRHPAHRNRRAAMLAPRGQRDIENLRRCARVFKEQLEEIAHAVKQQRSASLTLQRKVLLHHRGDLARWFVDGFRGGHGSGLTPTPAIRYALGEAFPYRSCKGSFSAGRRQEESLVDKSKVTFTTREALFYHETIRPGKIEIIASKPMASQRDLSLVALRGMYNRGAEKLDLELRIADKLARVQNNAFAVGNGVPPSTGVNLVNNNGKFGPARDFLSFNAQGVADWNLDGALCLRELWTGGSVEAARVREGVEALRVKGNLGGRPAIIVHGRADALVPVGFTSRPYLGKNQLAEGPRSKLRYIEVTNAQHFDGFISLFPGYDTRYVPLHAYYVEALDRMYAHLTADAPLPPSQVVRTTPRAGTPGAAQALTVANVPPMSPSPAAADRITVRGGSVVVPD